MTNEPEHETKTEPKPELKEEPQPEAKVEPKPKAKDEPPFDLTPQIVKRVHEFYEELGRKDVQAVQELDNAELEPEKLEVHK